jgi:tRNA pseudouridine32 synthase/23S rRNA pseudouridine746 synthase
MIPSLIPDFSYDPPTGPLVLLHEDAHILVVDKPAGLLTVPGKLAGRADCLITRLRAARWDALTVHRLDCDTSGVIIFARTKTAQGFLGQEFEKRRARKTYTARVHGVVTDDKARIDLPLCVDWPNRPRQMIDPEKGKPAQTDYEVLSRTATETRLLLHPLTGRSHQLRVHMLALGHPIVGDQIYATAYPRLAPRLMLHATTLGLHHPGTGAWAEFASAPPF